MVVQNAERKLSHSDMQKAAGDIISRKNNRATGYLEEEQ